MHISHCLFPRVSWKKKKVMPKAFQRVRCSNSLSFESRSIGKEEKLIVDPEARLEEELIIRPTSEAIIWNTYKDWIQSYRDLPILVNQWANGALGNENTPVFADRENFYGRKVIQLMPRRMKQLKKQKRCLTYMQPLPRNIWHCR
jgi:hypothetical protein